MNSTDSSVELSEDEFAALQLSPNSVPCVVLKEEGLDWAEEKAVVAAEEVEAVEEETVKITKMTQEVVEPEMVRLILYSYAYLLSPQLSLSLGWL